MLSVQISGKPLLFLITPDICDSGDLVRRFWFSDHQITGDRPILPSPPPYPPISIPKNLRDSIPGLVDLSCTRWVSDLGCSPRLRGEVLLFRSRATSAITCDHGDRRVSRPPAFFLPLLQTKAFLPFDARVTPA